MVGFVLLGKPHVQEVEVVAGVIGGAERFLGATSDTFLGGEFCGSLLNPSLVPRCGIFTQFLARAGGNIAAG